MQLNKSQGKYANTFVLYIHVAPALLSRICLYDGVSIFRGTRVTPQPVVTLCGSEVPEPISVFGPMLLNFYTDSHIAGFGFQARYRTIGKCPCPVLR